MAAILNAPINRGSIKISDWFHNNSESSQHIFSSSELSLQFMRCSSNDIRRENKENVTEIISLKLAYRDRTNKQTYHNRNDTGHKCG